MVEATVSSSEASLVYLEPHRYTIYMSQYNKYPLDETHEMDDKDSPGAFIFMVKDGMVPERGRLKPVRWILSPETADQAIVRCGTRLGPDFGNTGFSVGFRLGGPRECIFYLGERVITMGVEAS